MRDIKFRAWDKVNNRMFEGWMLDGSTGDGSWKGGHFGDLEMLYSSVEGFDAEELGREGWNWIDAENVELMQFTGLKDKNGVEIYEGDLLKDGKGQIGIVLWHRNSFLVEWGERNSDGTRIVDRMYDACFGYGEVIGNIYENDTQEQEQG